MIGRFSRLTCSVRFCILKLCYSMNMHGIIKYSNHLPLMSSSYTTLHIDSILSVYPLALVQRHMHQY